MPNTGLSGNQDRIAVIDVGSNTVRMVIYGGPERAPVPMLNERSFCKLGAGIAETGRLNPAGVENAVHTISRFANICSDLGVSKVKAFATSAVRDAEDGRAFRKRVRQESGIKLKILSGPEEAEMAAYGVLLGTPGARGVVGDLGGGSLEFARLNGRVADNLLSLPVGPLRFADIGDLDQIHAAVADELASVEWLESCKGQDLFLVGGTWRTIAKMQMWSTRHPLNVVDHYEMDPERAIEFARHLSSQSIETLNEMDGASAKRSYAIPVAAVVMQQIIQTMQPRQLLFSACGAREGVLYDRMPANVRKKDPLIVMARHMARTEVRFRTLGDTLEHWIGPLFPGMSPEVCRLRHTACILADIGWQMHPDYRAGQTFRRIFRAPFLGVTHAERAFIALSVMRRYSAKSSGDAIKSALGLVSDEWAQTASQIGAALRFALTYCGGAPGLIEHLTLRRVGDVIQVDLPPEGGLEIGETATLRLEQLAEVMGCTLALGKEPEKTIHAPTRTTEKV